MKKPEAMKGRRKIEPEKNKSAARHFSEKLSNQQPVNNRSDLIYGVLPVLEALRAGKRRIEKIFVADTAHEKRLGEIVRLAREQGLILQKVPRENLFRLVEKNANHQGIVAVVSSADYFDAEELLKEIFQKSESDEKVLTVVLDGVEDPRNFGAILRSVEGSGADGVFIPERRAVGLTDVVVKSSAGAVEYVKVAKVTNINNLIDRFKENNIWVVGTGGDARMNYNDWDWTQNSALILGGEGKGLHRLTAEKCDALVKIPMFGKIKSLNVSVAAGVILFEAVRQKMRKN